MNVLMQDMIKHPYSTHKIYKLHTAIYYSSYERNSFHY